MTSSALETAWLREALQQLRALRVCEVSAGHLRGAMFLLGFGQAQDAALRRYRATHSLFVTHASWRLSRSERVCCGWNDPEDRIASELNGLLGDRLKSVSISECFDLDMVFESKLRLRVLADVTAANLGQFEDNWLLLTPQHVLAVTAQHRIQVSPSAPTID